MKTSSRLSISAADLVPPLAAATLVVLFTALGFWQLDRADQKRALEADFKAESEPTAVTPAAEPERFQHLQATGRYLAGRQFLIDNIVVDGRLGYYVITPMALEGGGPLLLVNRGWTPKTSVDELPDVRIGNQARSVTGRAGRLPRVGVRPGEAFGRDSGWPKLATFPTVDELAQALDKDVLAFVLLADPDPASALVRRWEPREFGPERHIGYAFQWFALAIGVAAVTIVVYRRKRSAR